MVDFGREVIVHMRGRDADERGRGLRSAWFPKSRKKKDGDFRMRPHQS